jgi:hypothetical protein
LVWPSVEHLSRFVPWHEKEPATQISHWPCAASQSAAEPHVLTAAKAVRSVLQSSSALVLVGLHRYWPVAQAGAVHAGPAAGHSAAVAHVATTGFDWPSGAHW